ncbi:zinc finger protein 121-like [Topomyia yanbarensis]|uniref:zinc finger protein 121-like n=1 Tax=Topomyia yanbarensis TaxID=2498891 RepID=UPI00273BBFDD|nr:zinc finger protein 121-like [Topomyia yanbarensis]
MDFTNRCRGCLSNDEETLRSLEDSATIQLFEECIGLKMCIRPGFPNNICGTCYGKCMSWYKFRQQCWSTNDLLNFKLHPNDEQAEEIQSNESIDETNRKPIISIATVNQESVFDGQEYQIIQTEPEYRKPDDSESEEKPHLLEQEVEIEELVEECDFRDDDAGEESMEEYYLSEEADDVEENNDPEIVLKKRDLEDGASESLTNESAKSKDFTCDQCKMRFRSTERYKAHLRHHKGLKPEVCKVCSSEFNSSRALRRHMHKHTDGKKYQCKDCGKSYKYATSLTLHRKCHQDVQKFVCDLCGKSFIRAHGLKSHMLSHSTDTPFECDQCQRRFKNEAMLRNHVFRTHEGTKNFHCSDCQKSFATGAELRIHTRSHTNQKPFKCSLCDKRYKTASHLSVHFRTAHTSERPYACDLCSQTFAHSKVLKHHRFTHTGERPWSCNLCQRTFRQKSTLQGHLKTHGKKIAAPIKSHTGTGVVQLPEILTKVDD